MSNDVKYRDDVVTKQHKINFQVAWFTKIFNSWCLNKGNTVKQKKNNVGNSEKKI